MSVKWDGTKLLKTIVANEESTAKLYRAIAENANIGAKFFEILAADEERHKMIYEALLVKYADKLGLELDEAYSEYVDLLIRRNVVFDNKLIEDAKTIDRRDQILEIAERAERDAILFVSELQKMYPIMAKEEMAIILNEERSFSLHICHCPNADTRFGLVAHEFDGIVDQVLHHFDQAHPITIQFMPLVHEFNADSPFADLSFGQCQRLARSQARVGQ